MRVEGVFTFKMQPPTGLRMKLQQSVGIHFSCQGAVSSVWVLNLRSFLLTLLLLVVHILGMLLHPFSTLPVSFFVSKAMVC
jgi:hypothetical protein